MSLLLALSLAASGTDILTDDPHPPIVALSGPFAAGPKGTPLYTVDDTSCTDECLQSWPILEASADDKPTGDWYPYQGQWTYKRKFVHYFNGDRNAGKATGDGIGNKWHAIRHLGRLPQIPPPANAKVGKSANRFILTDYRGHTLYTFARDGSSPACDTECLEVWPPLLAPELAAPIGDWSPVDRPDGVRQWSYRGRLLYTFAEDITPSDRNGADAGGAWKVVTLASQKAAKAKD